MNPLRRLRRWRITWRGYSFGPGRHTWDDTGLGQVIRHDLHAAAEQLWPDGPALADRWPDCSDQDPCGTRWDSEADRAVWHACANHPPRGRHQLRATETATERAQ